MWRTDCSDNTTVTSTSAASRSLMLRLATTNATRLSSMSPKQRTDQSWKSGECHSRISDCCAAEPWVANG